MTEYRNLSVSFPEQGEFLVFLDPVYFPFEEENMLKYFDPEDTFLNIMVSECVMLFFTYNCNWNENGNKQ